MSENPFGVKVQLFLTFEVGTTLEISFISPHPKINKINYRLLFQIREVRSAIIKFEIILESGEPVGYM